MSPNTLSAAAVAANAAVAQVCKCVDDRRSFVLEAGAGAGKTHTLIAALRHVLADKGSQLLRQNQQIACITYTNVAREEIESRTDGHPAIFSATIHSFCWSLLKDFQPALRGELLHIGKWPDRLQESGGIGLRNVVYDLGYPAVHEGHVTLHHDDVLALMVKLLERDKFRSVLVNRFPILFIDEYQDTDAQFAGALLKHFVDRQEGPVIGFFGDHWQKIYRTGIGHVSHPNLETIDQHSNFRSVNAVVQVLNHMRPELIQNVVDPDASGAAVVYHTNAWRGQRRSEGHWKGDLPPTVAHEYLQSLQDQLVTEGWDLSPGKTKILMLTHNVLAEEQGYRNLANVFDSADRFVKKEDEHIAFLVDVVEPICAAYAQRRFGEMFALLGGDRPAIHSQADKVKWTTELDRLVELRATGTIGEVLDHLRRTKRIPLPEAVERRELKLQQWAENPEPDEDSNIDRLKALRAVPFPELIALAQFINGHTPFATQHGVKGAEFENVIVVVGRGWSLYNFGQMLEWVGAVPSDKREAYERSRNLFYVACSRPKTRLAVLFTQLLQGAAVTTLVDWFGEKNVHSLPQL